MARYDIPPSEYDIAGARIEIVAARFNDDIVSRLLEAALDALTAHRLCRDEIPVARVPGAFELPLAARWIAERGEAEAIIALGAVIRGDTPHFGHVCTQTARGLQDVSLEHGVPVVFGVLTCNDWTQADSRCPGPGDAFESACEKATVDLRKLLLRILEWESGKHQGEQDDLDSLRKLIHHCNDYYKKHFLEERHPSSSWRTLRATESAELHGELKKLYGTFGTLHRMIDEFDWYWFEQEGKQFDQPVREIGRRIEQFDRRLAELQAESRTRRSEHNKGRQAALAALEMVSLRRRLGV